MILLLTSSVDQTTDLLVPFFKDVPFFRFNIDLWKSYSWIITGRGYHLQDQTGRECNESEVGAVYLRKLLFTPAAIDVPSGGCEENWCRQELLQVWHGIRDLAHHDGKLAVINPSLTGGWNKIRQMRVAAQYFRVPDWQIHQGPGTGHFTGSTVVKTLGATAVGGGGFVMVKRVNHQTLNPAFPWFVQRLIEHATHDVTVAHVGGRNFAFHVSRDSFEGEDCRMPTFHGSAIWTRTELSPSEETSVNTFMKTTGLFFGRLDFLRDENGLWFLEMNPNGQFGWLDPDGSQGLLQAIAEEILSTHEKKMGVTSACKSSPA